MTSKLNLLLCRTLIHDESQQAWQLLCNKLFMRAWLCCCTLIVCLFSMFIRNVNNVDSMWRKCNFSMANHVYIHDIRRSCATFKNTMRTWLELQNGCTQFDLIFDALSWYVPWNYFKRSYYRNFEKISIHWPVDWWECPKMFEIFTELQRNATRHFTSTFQNTWKFHIPLLKDVLMGI